ncbi:hypothetical protein Pta02_11940 [Planobispora takensis]|uniref:Uncharacterized protein n=1 Tax=Planobispora takensis TaxID=1367882 RepID=A0A8J3WRH5_9ACTN|nr:hypothetical protein Pta02_11940 [Planobispora takensis]
MAGDHSHEATAPYGGERLLPAASWTGAVEQRVGGPRLHRAFQVPPPGASAPNPGEAGGRPRTTPAPYQKPTHADHFQEDPMDPECPGLAIHLGLPLRGCERLIWQPQPSGRYRVLDYTCSCRAVVYELVSCGGAYQIRKIIQGRPPKSWYAGRWNHQEAQGWWQRLLTGLAR